MSHAHTLSRNILRVALFALAICVLGATAPASLQSQVRRDTSKAVTRLDVRGDQPTSEMMQQQMEMMGPMMGQMMQSMMQSLLAILAKPETAERMATFSRNYYDALVAKGFTKDDAIKIVMAHGIPMPSSR